MKEALEVYINDVSQDIKALIIGIEVETNLKISAEKNYIKGNLAKGHVWIKLIESTIENLSIEHLNEFVQTLIKLGIPQLNDYLNNGIRIPYIRPFISLHKSELKLIDRYIKISINPEPIPK